MNGASGEEGFSLAELLVSLALLGMISALIAAGLGAGNKLWSLLSSLEPLRLRGSRVIDFRGAGDALEGVVALPPHVGLGGLYRLRLFLDRQDHQLALALAAEGKGFGAKGEITTAATGVSQLEIRYFGAKAGGVEAWYPSWENEERLPRLLAFKIKLLQPKLEWPEFMIAARLDATDWR
jgi:prepilin-type N-terminal cleavage/methylation domain-containing protein